MLDADFAVVDTWRLRHMAHRLVSECHERSIPECMKGVKVNFQTIVIDSFTTSL